MQQTVLVIDDSLPIHKLIKAHLEPERLLVACAYDAKSGLAAAKMAPSLILLDLDMPDLDGFEVCRRLKADPTTAAIPIIFLTANGTLDEKVKGLELGALDYITKPFKPREFGARVRASLRAKSQMDAVSLVDGLTGLWNRKYLDLHLSSHVVRTRRTPFPLACIVVEIDHAAAYKKKHTEPAFNSLFRKLGRGLLSQVRAEDVLCRCDEFKFVVLATGANRAAAVFIVERLRLEMERQVGNGIDNEKLTFSFGIADTHVADETDDSTLFNRADACVRRARQRGFNCVVVAHAIEGNVEEAA